MLVRRTDSRSEDAERADLNLGKSGEPQKKSRLFIDEADQTMDVTLSAFASYMDTGDSLFLRFAKDIEAKTERLTAALR